MSNSSDMLGYTIIEVMIFLAVSSLMFVIAAGFVNGKQSTSEFNQGINQITTQIQQVINNVSDGEYPNDNQLNCTSTSSGLNIQSGTQPQGSNGGCIFLGKVLQFGVNYPTSTQYNVYSVAGSQYANGGTGPTLTTDYANAFPTAVDPNSGSKVDLTQTQTTEWQLQVTSMFLDASSLNSQVLNTSAHTPIAGIGFFNSLGSYDVNGNLNDGIQSTIAIPFGGGVGTTTVANLVSEIDNASNYDPDIQPNLEVGICVESGNNYGLVTIGGANGERLTATSQIYTSLSQWHSVNC